VAPWRWPKLYPDEWLRHINEKHTHYTVEMRHEDGVFVNQGDLHPKVYHHGSRDLAALHIELEQDITELYMSLQLETELSLLSEKSNYYPLSPGQVSALLPTMYLRYWPLLWAQQSHTVHPALQAIPTSLLFTLSLVYYLHNASTH
jgi:hypothetical protein